MAAPLTSRSTLAAYKDYFNTCVLPADHPLLSAGELEEMQEAAVVEDKMVRSAKKKFAKFDTDGNQVLDAVELQQMAEWVYQSFHPNYKELSEADKKQMTAKLLERLDGKKGDGDGVISFNEFLPWFTETARAVGSFHKKKNDKAKAARGPSPAKGRPEPASPPPAPTPEPAPVEADNNGEIEETVVVDKMVKSAQKKFAKFDKDGNNVLDADELQEMAEWVYQSFHPNYAELAAGEKQKMTAKLMERLDGKKGDGDGVISFKEFLPWFTETAKAIGSFHKKKHLAAKAAKK